MQTFRECCCVDGQGRKKSIKGIVPPHGTIHVRVKKLYFSYSHTHTMKPKLIEPHTSLSKLGLLLARSSYYDTHRAHSV